MTQARTGSPSASTSRRARIGAVLGLTAAVAITVLGTAGSASAGMGSTCRSSSSTGSTVCASGPHTDGVRWQ